jgi:UDP-GlcNAc:undecaprenyl-phosphate GlcNAc-1-phosphate transferase
MSFFIPFLIALGLTLGLTPLFGRLARRFGFVDVPGKPRHVHHQPVPRLGVSLYLAFVAALAVTLAVPRTDPHEWTRLAGMLVGLTLVELMGLIDDRRELGPPGQLGTLLVASAIVIAADVHIDQITNPLGTPIDFPAWFALPFTIFWLMGMSVTVNWLDGLDGLAAGVTLIASAILFVHTAFRQQPPQPTIAMLPAALAGCALGFLSFNRHPARIFLGSSGAYFLGFALACLSIIGGAKVATALLVLGIPVLDVAWQIVARLRRGASPFLADRGHLHHRLYDLGLSQQTVVWLYWGLCAAFGLLALVLTSPVYKLAALVVMGLIAGAVLAWVARRPPAGKNDE